MPRRKRDFLVPEKFFNFEEHELEATRKRVNKMRGTPEWELWMQCLTPHQRKEARRTGWVPVLGSDGGRYLVGVDPGYGAPVTQISSDHYGLFPRARHRCFQVYRCSNFDASISKILLIQSDEQLFDRVAGG